MVDLNGSISQPVRCVAWRLRRTLTENRSTGAWVIVYEGWIST